MVQPNPGSCPTNGAWPVIVRRRHGPVPEVPHCCLLPERGDAAARWIIQVLFRFHSACGLSEPDNSVPDLSNTFGMLRCCIMYARWLYLSEAHGLVCVCVDFGRALATGQSVQMHPSSVLFRTKPDCVIFNELVRTTQNYVKNLTRIDPLWLAELAPQYYATED